MAQAFARFGSKVTLFEAECQVLPREDQEAAHLVREALHRDGVESVCKAKIEHVERDGDTRRIHVVHDGDSKTLEFDQVLVGVGRAPNVEGIGLETAGVEYDVRKGVNVDDTLRTTNPRIFAVGDVAVPYKFTHMAGATARLVIQNALFNGRKKHTGLLVPWCTYTQPELAHVGLYEKEAKEKYGDALQTFTQKFAEVDRAILEGHDKGFVRVHAVKGKIVGATIVGEHAGDLISEITVAMEAGMKLSTLSNVIHPYPTTAEAIQRIGDAYNRTRLTPLMKKLFSKWLAWGR
jgi:pyruvate/2-oxoglutarate dehydrogenase complex dihydrolipoamide dehydrogenase (E3) component